MELEYIWFGKRIDKDKNLIEDNTPFYGQEICFSKKYNINFEYKNEIYTLKINNKKDINNKVIDEKDCKYYKTFYKTVSSNDIGINLTCFVGKNGAGKTLLLEYIKEIFCSNKSDGKLQYLIIWNDNGLKYDSSENIEKIEIESSDITLIKDSFPKNDNKVIFYSSTFNDIETYKDEEKSPNLFDISLNNVVLKENQKINEFIDSKNRLLGSLNYDPFKKGEISRRIRFYINHVLSEMFDYFNHYSKGRLDSKDNSTNIENLEDKINEDKTFNRNFYLIMPSTVYSDLYEYNNKNIFYSLISSDTKSELATFFKCSTDFINKKSIENDKDNVSGQTH